MTLKIAGQGNVLFLKLLTNSILLKNFQVSFSYPYPTNEGLDYWEMKCFWWNRSSQTETLDRGTTNSEYRGPEE